MADQQSTPNYSVNVPNEESPPDKSKETQCWKNKADFWRISYCQICKHFEDLEQKCDQLEKERDELQQIVSDMMVLTQKK